MAYVLQRPSPWEIRAETWPTTTSTWTDTHWKLHDWPPPVALSLQPDRKTNGFSKTAHQNRPITDSFDEIIRTGFPPDLRPEQLKSRMGLSVRLPLRPPPPSGRRQPKLRSSANHLRKRTIPDDSSYDSVQQGSPAFASCRSR